MDNHTVRPLAAEVHCDWDMLKTSEWHCHIHAVARAVAGCPVYVSDPADDAQVQVSGCFGSYRVSCGVKSISSQVGWLAGWLASWLMLAGWLVCPFRLRWHPPVAQLHHLIAVFHG